MTLTAEIPVGRVTAIELTEMTVCPRASVVVVSAVILVTLDASLGLLAALESADG